MAPMPMLMEIELLHDYPGVPAGTFVVTCLAKGDGALLCANEKGKALFFPDGSYRVRGAGLLPAARIEEPQALTEQQEPGKAV